MTAEAILTVSAAVLTCTQFAKWSGVPDKYGPLAVLLLSALGVCLWVYSGGVFLRTELFAYFAGWIAVATSAAGVYGFSRASAAALVKALPPPGSGAGSEPTVHT
jgi:hypothetical protein